MTVVTVAYGAEPWLERSVRASLASTGVDVDVIVVDNGCTDGAVSRLANEARVTVVGDGTNLGFAGGCNLGAHHARSEFIALVNPDALVEPDALAKLIAAASGPGIVLATASVRLADRPDTLNSCGLALHFLGVSWAGHFDEPAAAYPANLDVAGASGACMVARRASWETLGGFAAEFFAYYEDCDLSLRALQRGGRSVYVADAVAVHRYEFSRNAGKFYLVERNRLIMVLSLWSTRMLLLLAPALIAFEFVVLALAIAQGWWREKLRSWWWLLRHASWIARRRRRLSEARTNTDRALLPLLEDRLDPRNFPLPPSVEPLQRMLMVYWRIVRRLL